MKPELFDAEQELVDQLILIKKEFGLSAIKAEFEAEGSSFRDILRLRRLTAKHDVPLYIKIGGVEALRDIKDALDFGVEGLIAPMVESPFGVLKFSEAVSSIYCDQKIFKSINIETQESVKNFSKILEVAKGNIDNITIGRTDLSRSYFDNSITPDSSVIFDVIECLIDKVEGTGLSLTVGGSINKESIRLLNNQTNRKENWISSIETRKIILPFEEMVGKSNALFEALQFEKLYLRYKLKCEAWLSRADQERLAILETRI